jgi:ankyrin repeat protein
MKKILLSLLLAGGVQYSFAMQGGLGGGAAAQGGAAQSALSEVNKQLIAAARQGNAKAVKALLERDADVNAQNVKGSTALMIAANHGHVAAVKALLERGADVNVQNAQDITALIFAAQNGHVEVVKALLAGGVDVNEKTKNDVTALILAAQNGHAEVVKALLDGGADVNLQNANDRTALMVAAQDGHTEAVKALLERGADVNVQLADDWTALMIAAQNGHVEAVKALLAGEADVDVKNANGWTALMIATSKGHVEVVRALLDGGADVNLKNTNGWTAIDYATGKKEIIELLKKQMPKPVKGNKASKASTASASKAVGGVACAGGGAGQNISKTLCTAVAAKILAEAGTQTEPIQVGSSQATAQERLSKSLTSAFSKPSFSGKQSSASQMDCDEARASGGIVVPITRQPNIAPHVAAIQVFYLQTLIAMARASGTGLSGLIQLLNDFAANVYFDASEAARLVAGLDFGNSFFAATGNTPITGLDLATLLNNSISRILGPVALSGFTPEQDAKFQILEAFFNQLS